MSSATILVAVRRRDGTKTDLVLLPGSATVGRDPDADLFLDDPKVSQLHVRAVSDQDGLRWVDQGSFNGLWFGGTRVPSCPIAPGTTPVGIGPFVLQVVRVLSASAQVMEVCDVEPVDRRVVQLPSALGVTAAGELTLLPGDDEPVRGVLLIDDEGLGFAWVQPDGSVWVDRVDDDGRLEVGPLALQQTGMRDYTMLPTDLAFDGDALVPRFSVSQGESGLPAALLGAPIISQGDLDRLDLAIERTRFLALGGGLGSFCWVDALRIHGVPASQIRVVGFESKPYARYARLCAQSQIPLHERLRSNSESCPDNLWGFPGYAPREALGAVLSLRLFRAIKTLWKISAEPDLSSTYTPRAGHVFRAIDREARRVGWARMLSQGRIRAIRRRKEGGFVVAVSGGGQEQPRLIVADHLHLSLGYPGVRFLEDLRSYREQTRDFKHVVNAYEDHEHVYERLARRGGTVVLRGRGIVASRVLQRLHEVRAKGADVQVVHLMQSRRTRPERAGLARRQVAHHWAFQPFNWPEAAWGGDLRGRMLHASAEGRSAYFRSWGGTTTADRPDWRHIVEDGLRVGWYRIVFSRIGSLTSTEDGVQLGIGDAAEELHADAVIDATGLVAGVRSNPVMDDLVQTFALPVNGMGGLEVDQGFEITALASGAGRAFAAGVTAFGNHYAPVDSFLGLQHAALVSMARLPVRRLTPERSLVQWLKWMVGARP